jgi:hypothetical protein
LRRADQNGGNALIKHLNVVTLVYIPIALVCLLVVLLLSAHSYFTRLVDLYLKLFFSYDFRSKRSNFERLKNSKRIKPKTLAIKNGISAEKKSYQNMDDLFSPEY